MVKAQYLWDVAINMNSSFDSTIVSVYGYKLEAHYIGSELNPFKLAMDSCFDLFRPHVLAGKQAQVPKKNIR